MVEVYRDVWLDVGNLVCRARFYHIHLCHYYMKENESFGEGSKYIPADKRS